jgi:hypothetical protein
MNCSENTTPLTPPTAWMCSVDMLKSKKNALNHFRLLNWTRTLRHKPCSGVITLLSMRDGALPRQSPLATKRRPLAPITDTCLQTATPCCTVPLLRPRRPQVQAVPSAAPTVSFHDAAAPHQYGRDAPVEVR